ncbi:hypothetical protein [Flindersiella endophytica]
MSSQSNQQSQQQSHYTAFDHTDLERRRKKLWNLAEGLPLTILGGIDLRALVIAGLLFVGLLSLLFVGQSAPLIDFNLWSILICLGLAVGTYLLWPRRWRNGMTTEQNLLVALDYLLLQPRRIHGLAADVEPEAVHWRVILWHPRGQRWQHSLAKARATRARHAAEDQRPGLLRAHPADEFATQARATRRDRRGRRDAA